jgi:hypothetical protein
MGIYAFLYDSGHKQLGDFYGMPCLAQFITALLKTQKKKIYTRILEGDVILSNFAAVVSEVDSPANSHTVSFNSRRYADILFKIIESIDGFWHTTDFHTLALALPHNRTYAICLPSLDEGSAIKIDSALKSYPPYLGATYIDEGNPLLREVFVNQLICDSFIDNFVIKTLPNTVLEIVFREEIQTNFANFLTIVSKEEFYNALPPISPLSYHSEEGIKAKNKILNTEWKSHREKLAEGFYLEGRNIKFSTILPNGIPELEIDARKLTDYCLNENHKDGKHKARVFKEKLRHC